MLYCAVKLVRHPKNQVQQAFALGTFMALIVSILDSIKQTTFEHSQFIFFIFGSIGIVCSMLKNNQNGDAVVRGR